MSNSILCIRLICLQRSQKQTHLRSCEHAGTSILFPGDLEEMGEKELLELTGPRVKSDILLSPHHGSRTSSSKAFLTMVAPKVCVISSGEDRFGRFPHPSVLKRLAQMGCESICISDSGAVTVRVEPEGFDIHSFLSKDPVGNRFFVKNPSIGSEFLHKD